MRKLSLESSFFDSLNQLTNRDISDKSFLLGVSGGSDSMCLANLFLKFVTHATKFIILFIKDDNF